MEKERQCKFILNAKHKKALWYHNSGFINKTANGKCWHTKNAPAKINCGSLSFKNLIDFD